MSNLSDNMETSADSMKLRMIREIENHFGVSISTVLGSDLEAEDISRLPDQLVNALDQLIRAYNPSFDLFRASLNKCFQDRDRPPIPTKEDIFIIHRIFFVGTTNSESYSAALAVTRNWTPPAATHQEPYIPPQSTASASEVSQSNSIASASAPPFLAARKTANITYSHIVSSAPHSVSPLTPAPMRSEGIVSNTDMPGTQSPRPPRFQLASPAGTESSDLQSSDAGPPNDSTTTGAESNVQASNDGAQHAQTPTHASKRPLSSSTPPSPPQRRAKRGRYSTGTFGYMRHEELGHELFLRLDRMIATEQERDDLKTKVEELMARANELEKEKSALEDEKTVLKGIEAGSAAANKDLEEKNQQLEREMEGLKGQRRHDEFKEQNGQLKQQNGQPKQQNGQPKQQNDQLRHQNDQLKQAKADLTQQKDGAVNNAEVANREKQEAEKKRRAENIAETISKAKKKEDEEKNSLKEENKRLVQNNKDFEQKVTKLAQETNGMKEENKKLARSEKYFEWECQKYKTLVARFPQNVENTLQERKEKRRDE
ncbi:hypothetical protein GTA08_BOTSDO03122 [Botryosphaeria dothidea]|uniref:Uncharacterized protein n=1 Tax=Botryosphaeria dothidea TaxID=55169 RepID=A0A8H4IYG5_9PEZI|nr:hypothetical protein GTA08_BOTSDO03122 [Botryosphaeria dothidea]